MSIKISLREPKGRNLSKLLHAIARYIDEDQGLNFYLDMDFLVEKEGEKE